MSKKAADREIELLRFAWRGASPRARRRFLAELQATIYSDPAPGAPVDDALEKFLSTRLVKSRGDRVQSARLYEIYQAWCYSRDEAPVTQTNFGLSLKRLGFVRFDSRRRWWLGVRVIDDA
ncbi:hypothetical protein ACVIW2_005059 [Bradyrhizobium huanghuaihaiense]